MLPRLTLFSCSLTDATFSLKNNIPTKQTDIPTEQNSILTEQTVIVSCQMEGGTVL
jgi:hypothetical protein